tara:strand:+ start:225 stop:533 length:309 start_codon:yes stop_codon:yes gene_type:complete
MIRIGKTAEITHKIIPVMGIPKALRRELNSITKPTTPRAPPITAKGMSRIPKNGIQQNKSAKAPSITEITPRTSAGTLVFDLLPNVLETGIGWLALGIFTAA